MTFDKGKVLGHVLYQINNAQVKKWPFSHFYVENVFPQDFYDQLMAALPPQEDYVQGSKNYNGRKFADPKMVEQLSFLSENVVAGSIMRVFKEEMKKRFVDLQQQFSTDLRLILDSENYSIGPHTDAQWKVVSLLFYMPRDLSLEKLGTSIYVPNDPAFRCKGGPHYPFEGFTEVARAPFRPNSLLGFFKTDYSFHGVEPITMQCRRDVLLWNLYAGNP